MSIYAILTYLLESMGPLKSGFFMSQIPYTGESQRDEHNKDSNTKRVMLYGWDADNLEAVRITATPEGAIPVELSKYGYNGSIVASATITYICKSASGGAWLIQKSDSGNKTMGYATVKNNPTVTTYANAVTDYLTLTYGLYHEAL